MIPKKLQTLQELSFTAEYKPGDVIQWPPEPQMIVLILGPPMYRFSRSYNVYHPDQIRTFTGYLSKFEPAGLSPETGEPEATVTITKVDGGYEFEPMES